MNTDMQFNENGYAFIPDKDMTKYAHEDRPQWDGKWLKGIPDNYIVLQVHHKEIGHVSNLLFDTKTQTPVDDLGGGIEQVACKLDLIKLKFQGDEIMRN